MSVADHAAPSPNSKKFSPAFSDLPPALASVEHPRPHSRSAVAHAAPESQTRIPFEIAISWGAAVGGWPVRRFGRPVAGESHRLATFGGF